MNDYRVAPNTTSSLLAERQNVISQKPPTAGDQNPRSNPLHVRPGAPRRNNLAIDDEFIIQHEEELQNI